MLVLTRKDGQSIEIANSITITVLEIQHGRVKIGIDAPPHIRIVRDDAHPPASRLVERPCA